MRNIAHLWGEIVNKFLKALQKSCLCGKIIWIKIQIQIRMMKMKNKKRFLKVISALIIAVLMIATFASCATGGSSAAADASGEHGSLKWDYKKDGQTLTITTITGTGAMENFEDNEDIAWGGVVTSVKKLVVGEGITSIGNYAFFGMSALEEVKLPSTLTSIGKLSFAFTSSLRTIELPAGVTTVSYGAFEASGLTSVTGEGVTKIEDKAFAYCKSLDKLKFSNGKPAVAEKAFLEANKSEIAAYDGTVTITFNLIDADGNKIGTDIVSANVNTEYVYTPKPIAGYDPVSASITVKVENTAKTVSVSYNKVETETETESGSETEPVKDPTDDKLEPLTIVALVVMVLVIIGVIIGVVLFIRNDKKNSDSRTVRKDKDSKKDKNKKK